MFTMGFAVFFAMLLLMVKLPHRMLLRMLHYDLPVDFAVTALVLLVALGQFHGRDGRHHRRSADQLGHQRRQASVWTYPGQYLLPRLHALESGRKMMPRPLFLLIEAILRFLIPRLLSMLEAMRNR